MYCIVIRHAYGVSMRDLCLACYVYIRNFECTLKNHTMAYKGTFAEASPFLSQASERYTIYFENMLSSMYNNLYKP